MVERGTSSKKRREKTPFPRITKALLPASLRRKIKVNQNPNYKPQSQFKKKKKQINEANNKQPTQRNSNYSTPTPSTPLYILLLRSEVELLHLESLYLSFIHSVNQSNSQTRQSELTYEQKERKRERERESECEEPYKTEKHFQ